jgi:hypothetical protein
VAGRSRALSQRRQAQPRLDAAAPTRGEACVGAVVGAVHDPCATGDRSDHERALHKTRRDPNLKGFLCRHLTTFSMHALPCVRTAQWGCAGSHSGCCIGFISPALGALRLSGGA